MADFGKSLIRGLGAGIALRKNIDEAVKEKDEREYARQQAEIDSQAEGVLAKRGLGLPAEADAGGTSATGPSSSPGFFDQVKEFFGMGAPVPRKPGSSTSGLGDWLKSQSATPDLTGDAPMDGVTLVANGLEGGVNSMQSPGQWLRAVGAPNIAVAGPVGAGGVTLPMLRTLGGSGSTADAWSPKDPTPQAILLASQVAEKTGLPVSDLLAMTAVESNFNPAAASPKGAMGLMQVLPSTFKEVLPTGDIANAYDNMLAGGLYMKQLRQEFGGGDESVMAYNAGPGAMRAGKAVSYPETQQHLQRFKQAKKLFSTYDQRPVLPRVPQVNV